MILSEFVESIYRFGLERFRRYYGPYRAIVVSNQDPQFKGRIQIHCPRARLNPDNNIWIQPMDAGAGSNKGQFWPPDIGDGVWIFFDNGDPTKPLCYMGGWYGGVQQTELNQALAPDSSGNPVRKGWVSPGQKNPNGTWAGGHQIILDDTSGQEQLIVQHSSGLRVLITNDSVSVGSEDGEFEPMIKGSTAQEWFNTHIHDSAVGPTSPPSIPFPEAALSQNTKTS
jgi:uncharacterized protein involved in type VI secretion and phage assembly